MDGNVNNKRKSDRILTDIKVLFLCDHFQHAGTASNCSDTGMCITTPQYIPCEDHIGITISLEEDKEECNLSARIRRIVRRNDSHDTLGVELLNPPQEYTDYLDSLRSLL